MTCRIEIGAPWTWNGPTGPREYVIDSINGAGGPHDAIVKLVRSDVPHPDELPGKGIAWPTESSLRGRDARWQYGHAQELAA